MLEVRGRRRPHQTQIPRQRRVPLSKGLCKATLTSLVCLRKIRKLLPRSN
jgi:hypothetical protein